MVILLLAGNTLPAQRVRKKTAEVDDRADLYLTKARYVLEGFVNFSHYPNVAETNGHLRLLLKDEESIWKDLIFRAQQAVDHVRKVWRTDHDFPRVLYSWPSEHLHTKDGYTITHLVSFIPPKDMDTHIAASRFARDTKAYGLLLIEKRGDDLKVIVESLHGARCWTMPIRRHGDVTVLEKESTTEDVEGIGVLWRRRSVG